MTHYTIHRADKVIDTLEAVSPEAAIKWAVIHHGSDWDEVYCHTTDETIDRRVAERNP